ncbi:MAG: hypothetical protein J6R48_03280 [Muribaculaceae bacterium]|nr:hypothetical protein [Muribaculaceae bacterium]
MKKIIFLLLCYLLCNIVHANSCDDSNETINPIAMQMNSCVAVIDDYDLQMSFKGTSFINLSKI